jgi:dolichol-phosphate mannosyltransferase
LDVEGCARLPETTETLKRTVAAAMAPLVDVLFCCALFGAGASLRAGHMASFALAMALNYLLKVRPVLVSQARTRDWRLHCRLGVVALLALFLRGGVLGLLALTWDWPAPIAIVPAVLAGLAITVPGYRFALTPAAGAAPVPVVGLIVYALALRLVYLGSVELLPEETYYWNYSRHLDIGYLDHPPMVAWLIRLGTAVFGQTEFGVRMGAYGCGIVASTFVFRLTRNLYGESSAPAAVALAQVLPYFFLSGLLMTPDAVLVAAWAASLYYLERALLAGRDSAWFGVGIALGVGCISKYSIGLLVPVMLAFMLCDPRARRSWRRWEPYGAALIALAIFSPVIVWNAQHDWASFAFQTSRRLAESPRFALHKLIAAALVLITPVGVVAIAAELLRTDGDARRERFVRLAVLVPLTVFAIFSLRHEVKLDWTGAPWTAALPLMAAGMVAGAAPMSGIRAWTRRAWEPTLFTVLLIYGAGLHYLVLGLPGLGYGKHIELVPVGWREFSRQIEARAAKIRAETGAAPLIVGMDRYAIASELAFYGDEHPAVETSSAHLFDGVGLMYERWTPARRQEGRTLLLVAWQPEDLTSRFVASHAERLGPVEEEILTRDGQFVRHYYQRLAYNYRSIPGR